MDTMRGFGEEDRGQGDDDVIVVERAPSTTIAIGTDERRMHVRAYNHWASLVRDQPYPSIMDLDPNDLGDFGPNSVMLDFSLNPENPVVAYLGEKLRRECGLGDDVITVSDVPGRSLISRLTDHYLEIIANRAPIGFEAEFVNARGLNTLYRGILMPYSSDGPTIDFLYGVINWKETAVQDVTAGIAEEVEQALRDAPRPRKQQAVPVWADGPRGAGVAEEPAAEQDDEAEAEVAHPDADDGLADWLEAAREGAMAFRGADSRTRGALYRALGLCYDFALVARARPDDYAELLEDAGMTAQARAPMTPVVKLVFGVDYDKGRLTEFAAALNHGVRQQVAAGELGGWLENYRGGLKAVVQAERAAKAGETVKPDRTEIAREKLRKQSAKAHVVIESGHEEFVVLIARRGAYGALDVLGPVLDQGLVDSVVRKAAAKG